MTKGKGQNSYTERKIGECFQRKTMVSCSRRDAWSFPHTHATGRPWDHAERSGGRKEISPRARILFSTESEDTDWREKTQTVWRPVLRLKLKIPCLWWARWKRSSCNCRHHPVCRGFKSRNRCIYGVANLWRADGEKKPQREVEKRRCSRSSCFSEGKKKSEVVHLTTQIQWILLCGKLENWDWTLRRDTPENLRMHLVRNKNTGKKRTISRCYPKRWTSWAKSLRVQFGGTNTSGNLTTRRLCQQSSDLSSKMHMLSRRDLGSDELDTLRRSRNLFNGTDRDWGKCK